MFFTSAIANVELSCILWTFDMMIGRVICLYVDYCPCDLFQRVTVSWALTSGCRRLGRAKNPQHVSYSISGSMSSRRRHHPIPRHVSASQQYHAAGITQYHATLAPVSSITPATSPNKTTCSVVTDTELVCIITLPVPYIFLRPLASRTCRIRLCG